MAGGQAPSVMACVHRRELNAAYTTSHAAGVSDESPPGLAGAGSPGVTGAGKTPVVLTCLVGALPGQAALEQLAVLGKHQAATRRVPELPG